MNESEQQRVFLVTGYDVGGNGGFEIERAFANEADARYYAEHAKSRKWNNSFGDGPSRGAAFDVEEVALVASLAEVADELNQEVTYPYHRGSQ